MPWQQAVHFSKETGVLSALPMLMFVSFSHVGEYLFQCAQYVKSCLLGILSDQDLEWSSSPRYHLCDPPGLAPYLHENDIAGDLERDRCSGLENSAVQQFAGWTALSEELNRGCFRCCELHRDTTPPSAGLRREGLQQVRMKWAGRGDLAAGRVPHTHPQTEQN